MHVEPGGAAGLGLVLLWPLKTMAERLFLGVGPGGEKGFRSSLSIHSSACGISGLA